MAADQRRKRLSCASIAPSGALEQRKVKKKKVEASHTKLTAKSHISLEWDENQNRVVAKGEQIGISLRHLRPYVGCASNHHNILGDVLTLPREIFELKDLTDVLSYEVWQTHLSENERIHLMQFLPQGIDKEQVLQMLFSGESFQFGNPFAKWGELVCSGQLHPDAVISHEKHLKADKKVYYSELQKYHTETIGFLQNLKENWESCEDPVIDDVQKISRSGRDTEQGIAAHAYESRLAGPEQDASVTSESCSWNADEKACSSNNQDSSADKVVEFQKRKYTKGSNKDKQRTSLITSDKVATAAAKPRNGDKVRKRNIQQNDGSEYMSYVKISKKQHELVKSMKHPGQSIQSRSLNRVLGSLDGLHVQSYDVFMEEEQRKLHEHWLKLAKEHLPAAYTNWRHIGLQKREIINSLNQDLHEKINVALEECAKSPQRQEDDVGVNSGVLDEDGEKLNHVYQDPEDNEPTTSESSMEDDADATMASFHGQSREKMSFNSSGFDDHRELESEKVQHGSKSDDSCSDASEYEYSGNLEANQGVNPSSAEDIWAGAGAGHSTPHSYHDSTAHHEYTSASRLSPTTCHSDKMIDLTSGLLQEETRKVSLQGSYHNDDSYHDPTAQLVDFGSGLPKEDTHKVFLQDSYHNPSTHHEYASTSGLSSLTCHLDTGARRSELSDLGSALPKEVTQRVFLPDSYHDPTARHEFASTSGLSLQRIQMVDLKSGLSKLETEKISLQGELNNNASFNCYPNQPRNDLLQSLFKEQQVLPYQEKRQTGLDFLQPQKNVFIGDSRFPGHFQEPSLPLEQGQMRQNETYLLPNLYSSSNSGRYVVPSAQELSNMGGDWNINPVRMTAPPFQQQLGGNGDLFSQNMLLPNAHQVQNGWNNTSGSVGVPNQGNAADQSLFSVLSQCSQLQSNNPYGSATRSTEQFISPLARNGNNLYGIGNSAMMNNLQPHQASNPLDFLGGRDATMIPGGAASAGDDIGWMNMNMNLQQHQNPGLHDPLGRPPYLRSWNQ